MSAVKAKENQLEDSFGSTLNLNEGIIIIYYAEKSIKNTPRGCYFSNDSLFVKYAEKGLEKMCSTVNSQLKLCRENSVDDGQPVHFD